MSVFAGVVIVLAYLVMAGAAIAVQYLYFRHTRQAAAPSGSRRALIILDGLAGISVLLGMLLLLTGWGYRFPLNWLAGTPFSDYTVPALLLGIVVGGSARLPMGATLLSARVGAVASTSRRGDHDGLGHR